MEVNVFQFILIVFLAGFRAMDQYSTQLFPFQHALMCWLVGIVLGDPNTGLIVGGTIQLMSMGAAGLGGSSAPDYGMAGMVATVLACITGSSDVSVGLAVGVAVAMLYVQLDVIFKIYNSWVFSVIRKHAIAGEYNKMLRSFFLSHIYLFLQGALPMAIVLAFGQAAIDSVLAIMPAWFTGGLTIAAGILPVTGFAMLLTFMPVNKFYAFLIAGYVLAAYLNLGVLPIALLGAVVAIEYFRLKSDKSFIAADVVQNGGELEDE
ncbi:PTS sugar transporter subunit IIC [Atopobium sp. oral taxon 810]|uniref:PTS mannose/fructose/sorbose/N-acetylgalactosamine transporter subunit IIC n=1 Tax=Atopobium sp. oral taxon 810 TaxID=712158 RepID=UPI000397E1F5|nr:PTS sugar transporter subunit IIC [Atopobium sp. oral taxon 810]ERI05119.1 PTS system sorbose-specific iic component [Atopobium sp. oral taxon 810 str. F0209]